MDVFDSKYSMRNAPRRYRGRADLVSRRTIDERPTSHFTRIKKIKSDIE